MRPCIHELTRHLRRQQEYVNEQQLRIADYENYIEDWEHEIKKPLSLMTLPLDNRTLARNLLKIIYHCWKKPAFLSPIPETTIP